MSELKKIVKGTIFVFVSLMLASLLNYISKIFLARYLGPAELGLYTLALTILYLSTSFAIAGVGTSITYFFSKERNETKRREFVSTLLYFSIVSLVLIGVLVVFLPEQISTIFGDTTITPILPFVGIFIIIYGTTTILFSILRGKENAKLFSVLNAAIPSLFLFFILFFGVKSAFYAVTLYLVAYVVVSLILTPFLLKMKFTKPNLGLLKKALPFTIVLFLVEILFKFRRWTDVWMLSWLSSVTNIGFYTVAVSTAFAFNTILLAFNFLYLPMSTRLTNSKKMDELRRVYNKICFIISLLTAPFTALLFVFAPQFIILVFGKQYLPSVLPFRILMLATFINSIFGPNWTNLIAQEEKKILLITAVLSLVLNIILNFAFIPVWGIIGAAIATSTSIIVWNILMSITLWIKQRITPHSKEMVKSILVATILVLPLLIIKQLLSLSIFSAIFVSIAYLVMYAILINFFVMRIKKIINFVFSMVRH